MNELTDLFRSLLIVSVAFNAVIVILLCLINSKL